MKISLKLAIAYLKKQKGRTLALITGITLAIMLIFGFNTIEESQTKNQLENIYKTFGLYDIQFNNINKDIVKSIQKDKDISSFVEVVDLGELVDKNGISIELESSNKDFIDQNMYTLEEGHLPKNPGEIVIEEKALKEMGIPDKMHQNLTFKIKKEYKDKDGINKIYLKDYKFELVGIVKRPKQVYEQDYYKLKAFTYLQNGANDILPNDLITYDGLASLKSNNIDATKKSDEFDRKYKSAYSSSDSYIYDNVFLTTALEQYNIAKSSSNTEGIETMVIIAAIFLIYNIFSISLTEIIKQIGTIRSIGASKKHIRMMIFFQSLILFIVGAIAGIFLGIAFSYLGIKIFNYVIMDINTSKIYISFENIFFAIKVGALTVLVSSIIPIYLSGRISPICALKAVDKSSGKQKNRFYYKYIRMIFGISGEMAYKNVWRNKLKTIISILAISLGGILFITEISTAKTNPFKYMDPRITNMPADSIKLTYNLVNTDEDFVGYTNEDVKNISKIEGVKGVDTKIYTNGFALFNENYMEKGYKKELELLDNKKNVECPVEFKGYEDNKMNSFKKFVSKGEVPLSSNKIGNYPNVLIFNYYHSRQEHTYNEAIKDLKIGDIIDVKVPNFKNDKIEYKTMKVRVNGFIDESWIQNGDGNSESDLQFIMPQKELTSMTSKHTYNELYIKSDKKNIEDITSDIKDELNKEGHLKTIDSRLEREKDIDNSMKENMKETYTKVSFLLLIAGLNIFITIKTNLMIRINEFSILRAIGMSVKQIKNMIIKESIIYALSSSLIASIIGAYMHYQEFTKYNEIYKNGVNIDNIVEVTLPINEIVQFTLISIIICLIAVYISKKKIEKLSIVKGLKIND